MKTIPVCAVFLLGLAAAGVRAAGWEQAGPVILDRTTAWVTALEESLSAVVTEERFEQRASNAGSPPKVQVTRADFLLVRAPDRADWIPFRDVYQVNGREVRDHAVRLQKLLVETPATALEKAAAITAESSRYNIGTIVRTINLPTFPLMLLRADYRQRFEFRQRGVEVVNGREGPTDCVPRAKQANHREVNSWRRFTTRRQLLARPRLKLCSEGPGQDRRDARTRSGGPFQQSRFRPDADVGSSVLRLRRANRCRCSCRLAGTGRRAGRCMGGRQGQLHQLSAFPGEYDRGLQEPQGLIETMLCGAFRAGEPTIGPGRRLSPSARRPFLALSEQHRTAGPRTARHPARPRLVLILLGWMAFRRSDKVGIGGKVGFVPATNQLGK